MKPYKKYCKGCGLEIQYSDETKEGFSLKNNSTICKQCFRSKNYGEYKNNLNIFYSIEEISEIKNDNVIMIIDINNPYETFIENINKYVLKKNLIVIINKIDLFPNSISKESILYWISNIAYKKKIKFSRLALVSARKKINIDSISSLILQSNKNTSIIGYSNVGKSSIIKALFKSINLQADNLVNNSIGTTKKIINLKFENKIIKDYPGMILKGSYQNIMNIDQLKETIPKKEIKLRNYQLSSFQTILIGSYAEFNILNSDDKEGYQFLFSNLIKLERKKYSKNIKLIAHNIFIEKDGRYDIVISGLGIITFKSKKQKMQLCIPKEVNFNIINSLYE